MRIIALVGWCANACFGLYLLTVWLSHGGLRQQATKITVFPAMLIFVHPVLAVTGLSFWIAYLIDRAVAYAWTGFGIFCTSAILGAMMFTRWLTGRGGRHAKGAEQRFPGKIILVHGLVDLTTFILVLVAVTRASRRS